MAGITIIRPQAITPAMIVTTDVPEADYAAWAAGTTYALGARVIVVAAHKVYESLQAGNVGHDPTTSPTWWVEVSATNRWALFDTSSTTATSQAGGFTYTLAPGEIFNSLAMVNVAASSVRVRVVDPTDGAVYDRTRQLIGPISEPSWYAYFFDPVETAAAAVFTDLPAYSTATVRVDFIGSGTVSCGVLLVGRRADVGVTVTSGAAIELRDYSIKKTDDFGQSVFVRRSNALQVTFSLIVENSNVDAVTRLFRAITATPCMWICSSRFESMQQFGFFDKFRTLIKYPSHSECELSIQGLT